MTTDIDTFDRKIINVLASNGRISVTALADRIGLSKSPTQARLRKLEEDGVIRGYRAHFDPVRLGQDHVTFVEVRLKDASEVALLAFNTAVSQIPEIEDCHMVAGNFDYLLKVRTRDVATYRSLLASRLATLPNVAQVSSHIAMHCVKENGLSAVKKPCKA